MRVDGMSGTDEMGNDLPDPIGGSTAVDDAAAAGGDVVPGDFGSTADPSQPVDGGYEETVTVTAPAEMSMGKRLIVAAVAAGVAYAATSGKHRIWYAAAAAAGGYALAPRLRKLIGS